MINRPLRRIALAAGALALLGLACLLYFIANPREPSFAALGSPSRCEAYSGLPKGWLTDPKAGMARLPAGKFTFGSMKGYPDERPAASEKVRVPAYWIDRTEVTVAQFTSFVKATSYVTEAERQGGAVVFHQPSDAEMNQRPYAWWTFVKGADWRHPDGPDSTLIGRENMPVTFVTQSDALAYARWLGRDLPTEIEWEYAGKAGQSGDELDAAPRSSDGKPAANYWQGVFPTLNLQEDGHASRAPVGCYSANPFGLHDMIGNVWEWTLDAYTGPHQPHMNGNTAAVAASFRKPNQPMVIKGGSFLCSPDFCVRYRASAREAQEADLATAHIGFRTVSRLPH